MAVKNEFADDVLAPSRLHRSRLRHAWRGRRLLAAAFAWQTLILSAAAFAQDPSSTGTTFEQGHSSTDSTANQGSEDSAIRDSTTGAQAPSRPTAGLVSANDGAPDQIVVFGRATVLIGTAAAASSGAVGGADLSVRPMLRVAELLEAVPGLIAVQHSGSGKANQYFLRGFNLDHGTDFTTSVDGVPWNLRSHGHGQGYLDVNGLMPETVQRIEYRKGPYWADVGDFSMAGSSKILTVDGWDRPFLSIESGQFGWRRLASGGTRALGDGQLSAAGEIKAYDGPWELQEHLRHESVWAKYSRDPDFGTLDVTLSGYHATWRPTEQIPERAIGTTVCQDEFCALDTSAVGETTRWIASVQLAGNAWTASGYLQYYDWHMLSDPTYDFQINQFDRRWTTGGQIQRTFINTENFEIEMGGEFRYDDIGNVGLDHTAEGVFLESISRNSIKETSAGLFAVAHWYPTQALRLSAGLRGDAYDFDVNAKTPGSFAGHATASRMSPKLGLAYRISDDIELYGNWGEGFHSNDARGVVNTASPVPGLVEGTGYETGARFEIGGMKLTAAYWWLNLDSELRFVGDSNSVEPTGASKRRGYELAAFWRPLSWLGIDAVYTGSTARYVDNSEGSHIEGAVEHAGEFGASAVTGPWEASVRVRYLGPYALVPDNSRRAQSETTINLRTAYTMGRMTIYGELLNLLDDDGKDIVYDYPAYVAGLDAPGLSSNDIDCSMTNCRMSRVEEPRTLRLGVKFHFE